MDHLARGYLALEALNTLVLDEADRMLDMGFFDDIATVAKQCPAERQTLLFSATYPEGIEAGRAVHARAGAYRGGQRRPPGRRSNSASTR
jgi:superfamily II DNA/RNA helicase